MNNHATSEGEGTRRGNAWERILGERLGKEGNGKGYIKEGEGQVIRERKGRTKL